MIHEHAPVGYSKNFVLNFCKLSKKIPSRSFNFILFKEKDRIPPCDYMNLRADKLFRNKKMLKDLETMRKKHAKERETMQKKHCTEIDKLVKGKE